MQATIVKPEQALPIKPFGLDVKVLLSTETTGGSISVLMGRIKPGEGPGITFISTRKKYSSSSISHNRMETIGGNFFSRAHGCGCVPSAVRSS